MKILKNLFGSKTKQNTKHEPNTLAEMNGSPDLRLATAKEKEVDIPLPKSDEVKKISKSSTKSVAAKQKNTATKSASPLKDSADGHEKAEKISPATKAGISTKSDSNASSAKQGTVKKAASEIKSKTKETTVKNATKKATETKKAAPAPAKKIEPQTKSSAAIPPKKSATKTTPSAPAKKEVKTTVTKKASDSTEKKTSAPATKKATSTKNAATIKSVAPATKAPKTTEKAKTDSKKPIEAKDKDVVTESKATRSGKFEIKKSKDGRFVFNLYASNNVIVATSQIYSSSTSAMNGIKSVIANAASAQIEDQSLKKVTSVPFPKWEIYQDKGEQYRFRLCASNGSCVCHSQGYTSKANCKKGIESIIKFASDAEITKVYLDKKEK